MQSIPGTSIAWRQAGTLAAVGLATTFLLVACGGTTAPTTAPDPAAACAAGAELKSSVEALDAVDLTTVANDDLKASIDAVATATDKVIETAPGGIDQTAEDMEGAVNVLEAAYEEAAAGTIADSAAAIDAAILGVKTQAAAMELALKPSCP